MKPLLLVLNFLCAADATETHIALASGQIRERVIPSQNPYVVDGVLAGTAASASVGLHWLDTHEHPRIARILGWTFIGIRTSTVLYNARQLSKSR